MSEVPVLPESSRLLHIGPHKTGSTTLQAAFHQNRAVLRRQGVHYAGKGTQPLNAAMVAALGRGLPTVDEARDTSWDRLVAEIRNTPLPRVMISSEFFCEADAEHVRAILDRLDPQRTHVAVTLRPLSRIVASQWQQYVQNRATPGYVPWLEQVLAHPDGSRVTPSFWRRHRHDRVVERWAQAAGADRVTVVVVDESDPMMLMRTFEAMLALRDGTLVPGQVAANRSLTLPEVELVRRFNQLTREACWNDGDYTQFVRFRAVRHLQERRPPEDEPRLLTPGWAVQRTTEIAAGMVEAIRRTGVRVVGDLDSLVRPPGADVVGDYREVETVPTEVAVRLAAGVARAYVDVTSTPVGKGRSLGPFEESLRLRRETEELEERRAALERRPPRRPASALGTWELLRQLVRAALPRGG
jgi:hypothetical protein